MTFPEKLRKFAAVQGFPNQFELAKAIGISKSTLARWLNGEVTPDLREAVHLARMFDTSVDFLAFDDLDAPHTRDVPAHGEQTPPTVPLPASSDHLVISKVVETLGPRESLRRLLQVAADEASDLPPSPE